MENNEPEFVTDFRLIEKEIRQIDQAYDAIVRYTNYHFSSDVPKKWNPEEISARKLQSEITNLNERIEFLEDVLAGKIRPNVDITESSFTTARQEAEKKKQSEENRAIIQAGVEVLRNWRAAYNRRLNFLKLQQPVVKLNVKKAQATVQEAAKTLLDIENLLKEKLQRLQELNTKYNKICADHERLNLDQNLKLQSFPPIPQYVRDLRLIFKVIF